MRDGDTPPGAADVLTRRAGPLSSIAMTRLASSPDFKIVGDRTNFKVDPKSRMARLPRALRPFALIVRAIVKPPPKLPYVYEADGIATAHYTPFLTDRLDWDALYWTIERDWHPGYTADMRWRVWLMTSLAERSARLEGDFAEFGTYRGGCARMVLETSGLGTDRRMHLFDTFAGIPASDLTARELEQEFAGRFEDSSVELVRSALSPWADQVVLHKGDVFEVLPNTETGPLSFVHVDLNATAPTFAAMEYAWQRLVPGGTMLLDDYGWPDYPEQRIVIDEFFAGRPEAPIVLPTGQAFVIAGT